VSTPSYRELVAAIRLDGEGIVSASGQGVDAPVPTCPGWTVADLCRHVGSIYAHVARIVGERLTTSPGERAPAPDGVDPAGYVEETLDDLVEALGAAEPGAPVWNWSDEPDEAAFWARRMAHESAVHRFDAQRAHGVAQPVDDDLAADGLDELIDVIAPYRAKAGEDRPAHTYLLESADATWELALGPDGLARTAALKTPDVTVRGTASALLLAAYNRVPWSSLDVDGDRAALEVWSASLRF
jgi:uncharacterized protein (TIGR03083 family)